MKWIIVVVLLGGLLWWYFRYRKEIADRLIDDIYIANDGNPLRLNVPAVNPAYRYLLGERKYHTLRRQMESKVIHLEPLLDQAQKVLTERSDQKGDRQNVYFSCFHPQESPVSSTVELVVTLHPESLLDRISQDDIVLGRQTPAQMTDDDLARDTLLVSGTKLMLVPEAPGILFFPKITPMVWVDNFSRVSINMRASDSLVNQTVPITLTAYLGAIAICKMTLQFKFVKPLPEPDLTEAPVAEQRPELVQCSERIFRHIFASFAFKDREIVDSIVRAIGAMDDLVLTACLTQRGGKQWRDTFPALINQAESFQLLWSGNAATYDLVKQEWQQAREIAQSREANFLQAGYWHTEIPHPPPEFSDIRFQRIPVKPR